MSNTKCAINQKIYLFIYWGEIFCQWWKKYLGNFKSKMAIPHYKNTPLQVKVILNVSEQNVPKQ